MIILKFIKIYPKSLIVEQNVENSIKSTLNKHKSTKLNNFCMKIKSLKCGNVDNCGG